MTTYYVDDGGSATSPYDTWAKAATSLSALDDAITFVAGDVIYIGSDHVCQYVHSGSRTITGPGSGVPVKVISASTADTTYAKSSTNQIDTSESNYHLTLSGAFSWYGIRFRPGNDCIFTAGSTYANRLFDCTIVGSAGEDNILSGDYIAKDLTVDLTADGSTPRAANVIKFDGTRAKINGLSFVNAGYRTAYIIGYGTGGGYTEITGADFSGFTNATLCELVDITDNAVLATINNCLTASTWAPLTTSRPRPRGKITFTNCGPANAPTYLVERTFEGDVVSTNSIYRSGGATIEETNLAWLITTTSVCVEAEPMYAPWMYGVVNSTGSKTFDVYITNDTADFTDAEVWLEIEYFSEPTEAIWDLASNQRATITTTAVAQTDDTTSTWNGSGPSFTYKQKLSVTATVDVAGLYRARVCVGVASLASSRYFYVDPIVTVS